jgi:3-hydroxyacyl-CoA dehydrogenase/enoyl-CoA hydratase/3-hydroxybutyryl-CoA epimerase
MAAHHRVLARDPAAAFGLPDVLVGLLPGAGGTQRLPRLVGMRAALPILLDAARLADGEALDAGLASELAEPGDAVARAEAWLLGDPDPVQPWDRADWQPLPAAEVSAAIAPVRTRILSKTLGHYPAPLAILDCVEFGLPQSLEGGIRSEAAIFAELIQREEPRNMIATMFTGRTDYERLDRAAALPTFVGEAVAAARQAIRDSDTTSLAGAGFWGMGSAPPARTRTAPGYWIDSNAPWAGPARVAVARIVAALAPLAAGRTPAELRLLDYAIVNQAGYPAYLGGPFARRARAAEDQSSA